MNFSDIAIFTAKNRIDNNLFFEKIFKKKKMKRLKQFNL